MDIVKLEREIKSFLRDYNKAVANDANIPDEGIYDYDKLIDSLSYLTKTLRSLERVQKKSYRVANKAAKKRWNLFVSYGLNTNDLRVTDAKIDNIVKAESTGSGAGFGERDITYQFPNKEAAADAKRKLKAKFRNKIRCEIAPE
jgi:hypothetical protein